MLIKDQNCPNCDTYYDPTLEKCPVCHKPNELYLDRKINTSIAFMHPIAQIGLFLAGLGFAGMLIAQIIFASIFSFISDELLFKTIVIFATYLLMVTGLCSIVFFTRRKHFITKYKRPIDYIYGIGYAFTLYFAAAIISAFVSIFYKQENNNNQAIAVLIAQNYPIIGFIVMAVLGPICEELTYRVGLYSFLRRINKYLALAISAVIFALIHFDFQAENIINELWALPTYLVSGVVLGLAYEHRGPACSMTAHLAYNLFAFFVMLIYGQ